VEKPVSFDVLM